MTLFDPSEPWEKCDERRTPESRMLCGKRAGHDGNHGDWYYGPPLPTIARPAPVARNDDPWTSHVAAERIEPKRETRRWKVLMRLREARGCWVPGSDIAAPDVGGSEGLRRLRELRVGGWPIERRPAPSSSTAWEYRLPVAAGVGSTDGSEGPSTDN